MSRTFCVIGLLCAVADAQQILPDSFSRADRGIRVHSRRGETIIGARAIDVDLKRDSGQIQKGYLTILYDQAGRHYLWNYHVLPEAQRQSGKRYHIDSPEVFANGWIPFITDQRILMLSTCCGHGITVWESTTGVATSMDEAERLSLQAAHTEIRQLQRGGRVPPMVRVGLLKLLGESFFYVPGDSHQSKPLELVSVAQLPDGKFDITVQCLKRARLTLDSAYKIISHQILP